MFDFFKEFIIFIQKYKYIILGIAAVISGVTVFLKNYYSIVNLRLQNRKIKKEERNKRNKIEYDRKNNLTTKTSEDTNFKKYINNFNLEFSEITNNALNSLNIEKGQLINLLYAEFKSHPIFTSIDYESLPIPLKKGLFVIVTKLNRNITIENVNREIVRIDLHEVWTKLCDVYLKAYALPFRRNHQLLSREYEFKKTDKLIEKLILTLHEYYVQAGFSKDKNTRLRLHKLKNNAQGYYKVATVLYYQYLNSNGNTSILGEVSINLDLLISSVHKILIEYKIPE